MHIMEIMFLSIKLAIVYFKGKRKAKKKMKMKILTLLATIAIVAYLTATAVAVPPAASIYDIQRTAPVGSVHLSDSVAMTATTDNSFVNTVVFTWIAPDGTPVDTQTDSTPSDGFTSSYVVNTVGQWTVTATFERIDSNGVLKPIVLTGMVYQIDANPPETFFVLPEYPVIGAVGIAVPMALALLVFKRKQQVTQ
jgi:hypothetical protein